MALSRFSVTRTAWLVAVSKVGRIVTVDLNVAKVQRIGSCAGKMVRLMTQYDFSLLGPIG